MNRKKWCLVIFFCFLVAGISSATLTKARRAEDIWLGLPKLPLSFQLSENALTEESREDFCPEWQRYTIIHFSIKGSQPFFLLFRD